MKESVLMSRTEVAKYFGVSVKTVIRLETRKKLKPIKLNDSDKGCVYYRREEVYQLITQK